jgi:hypothetical protein
LLSGQDKIWDDQYIDSLYSRIFIAASPHGQQIQCLSEHLGLTIPVMVLIMGFVSLEWLANYVPLALYRVVILIFIYVG